MTNKNKWGLKKGVFAVAAIAAGYYFYASKDAKKNRQIVARWAVDLKKDVIKRAKGLRNIDRSAISSIVEQSARAYNGIRNIDRGDIERAAGELKKNWKKIAEEVNKGSASAIRAGKGLQKRGKSAIKKVIG